MRIQDVGILVLAVLIIGFIGTYALIYPNSQGGLLALGALMPLAGAIGTYFFHSASQAFLGNQLAAQRSSFVQAITSPTNGSSNAGGLPSATPTPASTTPATAPITPPTI